MYNTDELIFYMKADRDLSKLSQPFQSFVEKFLLECEDSGLPVFVTEAYRSQERQEWLYAQGRTRPGKIVTWTLKSKHTDRQAIDIAFNYSSGIYPTDFRVWEKVYDIAEKHHILSLYRKYSVDKPHLSWAGTVPYIKDEPLNQYIMDATALKQLQVIINANSVMWNLTEDEALKDQLAKMNKYLRGFED